MTFSGITPFMISLFMWVLDSAKTLGGIACVAGAKRGGGGGGKREGSSPSPQSPSPFSLPSYPLPPTPFDACYAG